ncbi:hypothetical protein BJX76DRAFT_332873 [Aspergillus varians]
MSLHRLTPESKRHLICRAIVERKVQSLCDYNHSGFHCVRLRSRSWMHLSTSLESCLMERERNLAGLEDNPGLLHGAVCMDRFIYCESNITSIVSLTVSKGIAKSPSSPAYRFSMS